jgi:hypothetical protein
LIEFIQANPDPRKLKRALAVQMVMQNYNHSKIRNILGASYHRSAEFKAYLDTLNQELNESEWKVTCIRECT